MKLVGPDGWRLEKDGIVSLKAGLQLDFGGAAKGYAADRILNVMKAQNVTGFVSLGGCIACRGTKPGGKPFCFGLKTPEAGASDCFATLTLPGDGVLSTSGDYERFYRIGGRTYSCILDPLTGRPSESLFRSVTVFGPDGTVTDILSTWLMLLTPRQAFEAAEEAGCWMIAVGKDDTVYLSEELRDCFVLRPEHRDYTLRWMS